VQQPLSCCPVGLSWFLHELGQLIHSERDAWSSEGEVLKTSQNPFCIQCYQRKQYHHGAWEVGLWKEECELLEHRSSLYYAINHGCTYAGKGRCHLEGVGLPLLRNNVVHPYPSMKNFQPSWSIMEHTNLDLLPVITGSSTYTRK